MKFNKDQISFLEAHYKEELQKNPNDSKILSILGLCASQQDDLVDAYDFIQKAILLDPDNPKLHNNFGNVYNKLGKFELAIKHYQKAIQLNPYYGIAYNNIGTIYLKQNNISKAQFFLEKAINLLPQSTDPHYNLATIFSRKRLFDKALEQLDSILAIEPKNSRTLHMKAQILYQQENLNSALYYYQEFLKLEPYDTDALYNLGSIFLKLHNPQEAAKYFLRLIPLSSDSENYYNLGIAYMEQEKHQEAIIYFEQALHINPDYIEAHNNLGAIFLKLNDHSKASSHYKEVLRIDPKNIEASYILDAINDSHHYTTAPSIYIENLFNQYAPYYDQHLTKILDSKIPYLIHKAIIEIISEKHNLNILDLGCGTGLIGEKFHPIANTLIGIDLSEKMLEQAKQKNFYTELVLEDINNAIKKYNNIDLVIAADTLVYIGNLEQIFYHLTTTLKPNGMFAFTIETTSNYPYCLQKTARFAHDKKYIQDLSHKYNFDIILCNNIILRKHYNTNIEGLLYVLRNYSPT